MAVSGHPLATMEAIRILQAGGSVVDAGIAASVVLTTVMQQATSPAGDIFMLIHHADGGTVGLNGSGPAPQAATPDKFPDGIPKTGPLASVVPGIVGAWQAAYERHGRLPWADLFASGIDIAGDGYPLAPVLAGLIAENKDALARDPGMSGVYLPGGEPLGVGDMLRQPALARTLSEIAEGGAAAFYEGRAADAIGRMCEERGGLIRADDFKTVAPEWVTPIETDYRGLTVRVMPPNSFGILLLLQLNALGGVDPTRLRGLTADRFEHFIHAARAAFAEGEPRIADPAFADIPLDELLGEATTARLRAMVDAPAEMPVPGDGTSALSVADGEGNGITFVQSVFAAFGSFVLEPETGLLMNNRLSGFKTEPGHPSVIAPGKRPPHTLNPTQAFEGGRLRYMMATPGAQNQTLALAQVISNLVDQNLGLAEAVSVPRWAMDLRGEGLFLEGGVSDEVLAELDGRGIPMRRGTDRHFGSIKAIGVLENGALTGVADHRRNAFAAGF